jgi:hypothetical protein
LNETLALPCDQDGDFLPPGTPPSPWETPLPGDWTPFSSEVQFKVADLLYRRAELSTSNIDLLLDLWAESLEALDAAQGAPFENHEQLYSTIDSSTLGDIPWQCLVTGISDDVDDNSPKWMRTEYEVWYRDPSEVVSAMLSNPDFDGQFDLRPYIDLDASGKRRWNNVMSGNMAWRHSVSILVSFVLSICPYGAAQQDDIFAADPTTEGSMYCPIILGSDKTTVSVATGHVEYHPLYLSIGNPHNAVRRAHRNAVIPIAFLAIPKCKFLLVIIYIGTLISVT